MRIFLLINSFGSGGAERSTFELGKFLCDQSFDVHFVALRRTPIGVEQQLVEGGFNTHFCPSKRFISRVLYIIKLIKQYKPDVVHSVLFESNLIARTSQHFVRNVKYIETLANTPYSKERLKDERLPKGKFMIVKWVDALTARLSGSYYHAVTGEVLEHYRQLFGIKNRCWFVIYRGRGQNQFIAAKSDRLDSRVSVFKLINTGRHEFQKGQVLIVNALASLKNEKGITDIYLDILGREGSSTEELRRAIATNKLEDQVSLLGYRTDVEERLARADCFVLPSYFEGVAGAMIEAFAAGLPCICSDLPGLREVVGDDNGALFVSPGDERGLALQILRLYESKVLQGELSAYASRRFAEKFKIESISEQMKDMYETVLRNEN